LRPPEIVEIITGKNMLVSYPCPLSAGQHQHQQFASLVGPHGSKRRRYFHCQNQQQQQEQEEQLRQLKESIISFCSSCKGGTQWQLHLSTCVPDACVIYNSPWTKTVTYLQHSAQKLLETVLCIDHIHMSQRTRRRSSCTAGSISSILFFADNSTGAGG